MADVKWTGRFIEAVQDGHWEYARRVKGRGAAVVYAVTNDDELVLVEQDRIPLGRPSIELPAGIVGDGDEREGAAETARRELEEETGFRAAEMTAVGDFVTTPGLADETFTLFRARGLTRVGPGGGIEGEDITVHLVPLADLSRFVAACHARGAAVDKILAGLLLRP